MWQLKAALLALALLLVNCSSDGGEADDRAVRGERGERTEATAEQPYASSSNPHIATGNQHACSIFTAGKILCWGTNTYGQLGNGSTAMGYKPTLVSGISTAVAVSAGESHTCAVLSDGTIRCWGYNANGQLGTGGTTNSSVPVTVTGITTATAVAAGGTHTCARLSDSTVKCWGSDASGQVGNGNGFPFGNDATMPSPTTVSGITTATAITAGKNHSCALLSDRSLRCWGEGGNGQTGSGSTADRYSPVAVTGITNATAIAAGDAQTCARLSDSTVKCWGKNDVGQLGDGSTTQRTSPVVVSGLSTATAIGLGTSHACARLSDSTVKCWGKNDVGQLGNGTATNASTPTTVSTIDDALEVAPGGAFTCAYRAGGGIQCWGSNDHAELLQGTAPTQSFPILIQPNTLTRAADVVGGLAHTCILWETGAVKCWGANDKGQLGNGTTTASSTPVDVVGITTATAIAAGISHTCVLLSDSTVKCWGDNSNLEAGVGDTGCIPIFGCSHPAPAIVTTPTTVSGISTATQIGLGGRHSCARLADSTIKCWGRNKQGELGNNSTNDSATPVTVSGINNATAVAGGGDAVADNSSWFGGTVGTSHTCALLSTGGVKCWGRNNYGQLGNGNTSDASTPVAVSGLSSGATALALGMYSSCAVVSGGAVKCWGRNNYGQLGNGTSTNASSPVVVSNLSGATELGSASGADHFCARSNTRTVQCWGRNDIGQLGNATTTNSNVPVTAIDVTRALGVGAGGSHSCARLDDGTLMCWGSNASGQLGSGHQSSYPNPVAPPCRVMDVERSDYFVGITTANMPDPQFNGLAGQLDTHRVKPVFFPEACRAEKAIVLVHGRSVEATSVFDLQYEDYSYQENLARAGVDSFAMNHLGFGRSSGFTAMDNACNASLPSCGAACSTTGPVAGVCDCGFGPQPIDQQGFVDSVTQVGRWLTPNPLTARCAHTTNTRFINNTTMSADVDAVVDDVLQKTGLSKVELLGYSAGGTTVINYLGDADDTVRNGRTAKIERAIVVSPIFGNPLAGASEATSPAFVPSYPLAVNDRGAALGGFNVACDGQRDLAVLDQIWAQQKARDAIGATWGPEQNPSTNAGLVRYAVATRWGSNATTAGRISVPMLIMVGENDNVATAIASENLYAALPAISKTRIRLECASHAIFYEGCLNTGNRACNGSRGPHETIHRNSLNWIKSGLIYASPGSAVGEFGTTPDGTNYHNPPSSPAIEPDEANAL
jgi:alpha-tubulin suppressor-like RCC1 family protein/alpha-beta hydrolase superfamily lysophospholipase